MTRTEKVLLVSAAVNFMAIGAAALYLSNKIDIAVYASSSASSDVIQYMEDKSREMAARAGNDSTEAALRQKLNIPYWIDIEE